MFEHSFTHRISAIMAMSLEGKTHNCDSDEGGVAKQMIHP